MSQFLGDIRYTPEINMETKNEGLEDDFPFQSIQGLVFMFFCGAFGITGNPIGFVVGNLKIMIENDREDLWIFHPPVDISPSKKIPYTHRYARFEKEHSPHAYLGGGFK